MGGLCAALAVLASGMGSIPSDLPRMLLATLAIPVVIGIWRPPMRDLSRRLSEPDAARMVALVLCDDHLRVALRCCWLVARAGGVALMVLAGLQIAHALQSGDGLDLTQAASAKPAIGGPFAGLGLAVGLAALVLPQRLGSLHPAAGPEAYELVFALGAGLMLAFAPPPERAVGLALAAALIAANALPSLLALIALPWIRSGALIAGIVVGGLVTLLAAGAGALDGPTAVLTGLLANLALAGMSAGLPVPLRSRVRSRLQLTLAGPLRTLNRPGVWMVGVLWTFLALGPGWPWLCEFAGGPWPAGLVAAASGCAGVLWLRFRSGRASPCGRRAWRGPHSRRKRLPRL